MEFLKVIFAIFVGFVIISLIKLIRLVGFHAIYYKANPFNFYFPTKTNNLVSLGVILLITFTIGFSLVQNFIYTTNIFLKVSLLIVLALCISVMIGAIHALNYYILNGKYSFDDKVLSIHQDAIKKYFNKKKNEYSRRIRYLKILQHKLLIIDNSDFDSGLIRRSTHRQKKMWQVKSRTQRINKYNITIDLKSSLIDTLIEFRFKKNYARHVLKSNKIIEDLIHSDFKFKDEISISRITLIENFDFERNMKCYYEIVQTIITDYKKVNIYLAKKMKEPNNVSPSLFIWDSLFKTFRFNMNYLKPSGFFGRSLILIQSIIIVIVIAVIGILIKQL